MPMPQDFSAPRTRTEKIDHLLHDYVDGVLNRRALVRRLARLTGGTAAAMAVLQTEGLAQVAQQNCPAGIKVAEDDKAVQAQDITYPSGSDTIMAHLARPAGQRGPQPAVLVLSENRGLTDHIRDVTRRMAKNGYVGLGIDLLSRQGGTRKFPDDQAKTQAYAKTVPEERLQDIRTAIEYLQKQSFVQADRIGAVGFCAGGGNVYASVFQGFPLQAGVAFYGGLPNPVPAADKIHTPVLGIFSENDRNQATRIPELVNSLVTARVTFDIQLYKGTNHGFHNDTSPIYDPVAACDAWGKTLAWFSTYLRPAKG
jgi:carboxymethylenebutenolidase